MMISFVKVEGGRKCGVAVNGSSSSGSGMIVATRVIISPAGEWFSELAR